VSYNARNVPMNEGQVHDLTKGIHAIRVNKA